MSFFKRLTSKASPSHPPSPNPGGRLTRQTSQSSASSRENDFPDVANGDAYKYASTEMGRSGSGARPKVLLLRPEDSKDQFSSGGQLKPDSPVQTTSRLSKTFPEICKDNNALQCLLQYLDTRQAGHLLRFWFDAQSFQSTTYSRLQSTHISQRLSAEHLQGSESEGGVEGGGGASIDATGTVQYREASCDSSSLDLAVGHCCEETVLNPVPPYNSSSGCDTGQSHVLSSSNRANIDSSHSINPPSPQAVPDTPSAISSRQHCHPSPNPERGEHDVILSQNSTDSACATPSKHSHINSGSSKCQLESESQSESQFESLRRTLNTDVETDLSTSSLSEDTDITSSSRNVDDFKGRLKKNIERDAVAIYAKYISKDATQPIGITERLRESVISKICQEDGRVDPSCFVSCQEFVLDTIHQQYYKDFMQSAYHCKHQFDVLTGSKVSLADILYNESAIVYFMEYMEREDGMLLLQCWLELDSFQQHLASQQGQYDPQQAQNDAMVIYEKYFSLQAGQPLGFEDDIRFEVECNICREEGPLPDCFAKPKRILLRTIDEIYFQQYMKSDLYFKYLSDLISTVQTAQDLPPIRRKRTGSDASSEKSLGSLSTNSETVSSKNTLLATDTSRSHIKKALTKINPDMRIDGALFNPDSLWQRDQAGKMSLGKVDSLGQFISEFDPEPDQDKKKKGSFFKKKKEKEKEQEIMAMQIAQMIISDITNITSHDTELGLEDSDQAAFS